MKYAVFSVMLYLSVILQTTLLPRVNLFGVQPDLVCAVLVPASIVLGPAAGGLMGALAGLTLDLMFMAPGFWALQYLAVCLLIGFAASKLPFDRVLLPSAACFAGFTLKEIVTLMYLYLQRVEINFPIVISKLLLGGVFTVVLMLPLMQVSRAIARVSPAQGPSLFGDDNMR